MGWARSHDTTRDAVRLQGDSGGTGGECVVVVYRSGRRRGRVQSV